MVATIQGDGVLVYHGAWYNNAENLWILTLTAMEANYLLAALALYITFYSQDFWYMFRFILHTWRYHDPNPKHVIHHQVQAALRNSGNPGSYAFKIALIWGAWRKVPGVKAWKYCAWEFFYAILVFAGWIMLGIFVGVAVEEVPKDVLLAPAPSCGLIYQNFSLQRNEQLSWLQYREATVADAIPRVDGCWFGNWSETACKFYPVPRFEIETGPAECPLSDHKWCTSEPIEYTIGPMRSDHDLGIDTKPEDAVSYHRTTTCSMIDMDAFAVDVFTNETISSTYDIPNGTDVKVFDVGLHVHPSGEDPVFLSMVKESVLSGYFISPFQDADPESNVYWKPKTTIFPYGGNWNLFMLRQVGLRYAKPVNDPFLRATTPAAPRPDDALYFPTDLYAPDDLYRGMACVTMNKFCKVDNSSCTPWTRLDHLGDPSNYTTTVKWNPTQRLIVERLANETSQFSIASLTQDLGSSALYASQTLIADINIGAFSDRQWTSEVERWIATSLAILQYQTTKFTDGLGVQVDDISPLTPGAAELAAMCSRQRVGATGVETRNFHFMGVLACFLVGVVINGASLLGMKVNDFVQRFRSSKRPGRDWAQDGLFQLHRRHLELEGVEGFENCEGEVPVVDATVARSTTRESTGEDVKRTRAGRKEAVSSVQEVA